MLDSDRRLRPESFDADPLAYEAGRPDYPDQVYELLEATGAVFPAVDCSRSGRGPAKPRASLCGEAHRRRRSTGSLECSIPEVGWRCGGRCSGTPATPSRNCVTPSAACMRTTCPSGSWATKRPSRTRSTAARTAEIAAHEAFGSVIVELIHWVHPTTPSGVRRLFGTYSVILALPVLTAPRPLPPCAGGRVAHHRPRRDCDRPGRTNERCWPRPPTAGSPPGVATATGW